MGWIHTGILFGLSAVIIPIAVHLLHSRRYPVVNLGTLRFLHLAIKEHRGWRTLQDLLLLLARLMIVIVLTLLFGRPFLRGTDDSLGKTMAHVVLLDVSDSMNGQSLGVQNIELARNIAIRNIKAIPNGAEVTTAIFSDQVQEIQDLGTTNLRAGGKADSGRALQWAVERLKLSNCQRKSIDLVSDLHGIGLPDKPLDNWPLDVEVNIFPVIPPGKWNAAITAVKNLTPYLDKESELKITLSTWGEVPDHSIELSIEVEGQEPQKQRVPLQPGIYYQKWVSKAAGIYQGFVRINSHDAYPMDDQRHFAFDIQPPVTLLLVNGEPGLSSFEDETYFLNAVLKTTLRDSGAAHFKPVVVQQFEDLSLFDVVGLCNVGEFTTSQIQQLSDYLNSGGKVVYFLGSQVSPEHYAALWNHDLFPCRLTLRDVAVPRSLTDWNQKHAALRIFNNDEYGDLTRIIFQDAFDITPVEGAQVLAHLSNGSPAILEKSCGRGKVWVITNPCDCGWSDWPKERIFLPFVHELFSYLAENESKPPQVLEIIRGMNESRKPGLYGTAPLHIVTTDPLESNPQVLTEADFLNRLGVPRGSEENKIQAANLYRPPRSEHENEIWIYLAIGLLILMLMEHYLAERRR
jgi:hypothetical protein